MESVFVCVMTRFFPSETEAVFFSVLSFVVL